MATRLALTQESPVQFPPPESDAACVLALAQHQASAKPQAANCPRGAARSARLPVTEKVVGSNPIEDAIYQGKRKKARFSSFLHFPRNPELPKLTSAEISALSFGHDRRGRA